MNRRWLLIPPFLVGLAAAAVLIAQRQSAERTPAPELARPVRVIRVEALDVVPRALGHGTAEPGQIWRAVAEVRGRVVEVHPQLEAGATIKQGEVLLRIDPAEYELAVAQTEAEIARVAAQLDELAVNEANDRASLDIEEAALTVAEAELQRVESLASRSAAPIADRDRQLRAVLGQRQSVQKLNNALQLVPPQRKLLEAELAVKQTALQRQQLDVTRTVIRAPYDCRLGDVEIQLEQFLAAGQTLFVGQGTAVSEIETQVSLNQLRTLIAPDQRVAAPVTLDPETVQRLFDFEVLVRYHSGDFRVQWQGRVARMREQIDARTRTMGLIVAVDKPYEQAIPGERPPLVRGMFCEVELRGAVRQQQIVIPRAALHDGHVYVLDPEHRLRRRGVSPTFAQSSFLCLQSGLEPGELLVVSEPTPAIEGVLTKPVMDDQLARRLAAEASGETSLK